jgi:hypothetical protein
MNQKIKKGKSILLNTATNCTFIASELDEETQLKNTPHIEWTGELDIAVNTDVVNLPQGDADEFKKEVESLINKYSKENGSNTPDYILAEYLTGCLENWNKCVMTRSKWYGYRDRII